MQEIILKREIDSNKCVLGTMYLDNKPICKTLENPWLCNQVNISCIPAGKYNVKKFNGRKYQDVWILENVLDRTYILIHQGNFVKDTQGCLLVGEEWAFSRDGELMVNNSNNTLNSLRNILNDNFTIEIIAP